MSLNRLLREAKKSWHGVKLDQPDWSPSSRSLALGAELIAAGLRFHMIWNGYWEPLTFELPLFDGAGAWRRWIDTALDPPEDIVEWQQAQAVASPTYQAGARSVVVLVAG
jgi:glycogen operon protein